jgi:starch synthase
LETVKKFGWPPDIIHCSGWMTGLIPCSSKQPIKKNLYLAIVRWYLPSDKILSKEKLGAHFLKLALPSMTMSPEELESFKETTNTALFHWRCPIADGVSFGAEKVDKKLLDEFSKVKGKKILKFNEESDLTDYLQLYADLAG